MLGFHSQQDIHPYPSAFLPEILLLPVSPIYLSSLTSLLEPSMNPQLIFSLSRAIAGEQEMELGSNPT